MSIRCWLLISLVLARAATAGSFADRSAWRISELVPRVVESHGPGDAIDPDPRSDWRSPVGSQHGLVLDLERATRLAGLRIVWGNEETLEYRVSTSLDDHEWTTHHHTKVGDGHTDELNFGPVQARYLKLECLGWSDSGHSIRDLLPRGEEEAFRIATHPLGPGNSGEAPHPPSPELFDGSTENTWNAGTDRSLSIQWRFSARVPLTGLHIEWGENHARKFAVATSTDGVTWSESHAAGDSTGIADVIPVRAGAVRGLRLDLLEPARPGRAFEVRELTLKGADDLSPWLRMQVAARKRRSGLYSEALVGRQVYWTVVGIPGDAEESLLDEYGSLEPFQGSCSLVPFLRSGGELRSWADARRMETRLAGGYLPVPSVEWDMDPIGLRVEAFADGASGESEVHVRYSLSNRSSSRRTGELLLAIRPVSINPPWQRGGLSPISSLDLVGGSAGHVIEVNGRPVFHLPVQPAAWGARPFREGDIVEDLVGGTLPPHSRIEDEARLASGAVRYPFDLGPGETHAIVVTALLHPGSRPGGRPSSAEGVASPMSHPASLDFDRRRGETKRAWEDILQRVTFELPERRITDLVRSQLAYVLIHQDGSSLQPGSRKYGRAWIRDGANITQALLRFGIETPARDFIEWCALRVQPSGLVPPILQTDGSIFAGHGSNLEWDSQGEFVFTLMEHQRLTGDSSLVRKHFEKIRSVLEFLVDLRARTLAPDHMSGEPHPERFRGILPRSISHEGYYPPMHSYWDVYWSLRGLEDGARAARLAGHPDVEAWAHDRYQELAESTLATMRATMQFAGIEHVPGCAEKGDLDASAVSILYSPLKRYSLFPAAWLEKTFEIYFREVRDRIEGRRVGAYTPYELRNVTALVGLGHRDRAHELLRHLIQGVRPPGWNHWAEVVTPDPRRGDYIGDMPHSWVGVELVNLVRQMVVDEESDALWLLHGVPREWLEGDGIRVSRLPTHFGRLAMSARLDAGTLTLSLAECPAAPGGVRVVWPLAGSPRTVEVDGCLVTSFDESGVRIPGCPRTIVARW